MITYTVIFEKGPSSWGAYVPDLPGVVSTGSSREEVEVLIREAIGFHLEGLNEEGYPIPKPTSFAGVVEIHPATSKGMGTSNSGESVRDVHFSDDALAVDLLDGRTITVPLTWYPRLMNATPEQRSLWKVSGAGYGIHWSTAGPLRGAQSAPDADNNRKEYPC